MGRVQTGRIIVLYLSAVEKSVRKKKSQKIVHEERTEYLTLTSVCKDKVVSLKVFFHWKSLSRSTGQKEKYVYISCFFVKKSCERWQNFVQRVVVLISINGRFIRVLAHFCWAISQLHTSYDPQRVRTGLKSNPVLMRKNCLTAFTYFTIVVNILATFTVHLLGFCHTHFDVFGHYVQWQLKKKSMRLNNRILRVVHEKQIRYGWIICCCQTNTTPRTSATAPEAVTSVLVVFCIK